MNIEEEISTLMTLFHDIQTIVSKTSEVIGRMYEVIYELKDRVKVLEEKK